MADLDIPCRDLVGLAAREPAKFCEVVYRLAEEMRGVRLCGRNAGTYARAATEAGHALGDLARRYGREVDLQDDMMAGDAAA